MKNSIIKILPEWQDINCLEVPAQVSRDTVEENFLKDVIEFYLGREPEISDARLIQRVFTPNLPLSTYILVYNYLPIGRVEYYRLSTVWHFHFVPNENYKPKR